MNRKLSTREVVMIVGLALVGTWWLYSRSGGAASRQDATAGLDELSIGAPPVVNLASLERGGVPYDGQGRSLFKYYTPPPPPRPEPPRQEVQRVPREAPKPPPERKPTPRPERQRTNVIPPPKPTFEYLGFLGPKENKIAVFEDKDDIMLARTGDVVREQFVVHEFKYEGVVLTFTDQRFEGQSTELAQLNLEKQDGRRR